MSAALNLSRRGVFAAAGGLTLAALLPTAPARAQATPPRSRRVAAFLTLRPDGTILFRNPFVEGGQGINTGLVQVIAEELDADPARFVVEVAPPGDDYLLIDFGGPARFTGGSFSMRSSYEHFRTLGATARAMLLQAASQDWGVALAELTTEPGEVLHGPAGRRAPYATLAARAATLAPPAQVTLKDPGRFRIIGQALPRLEARAKSTGQVRYGIDAAVPGMLQAAVRHAPRGGMQPGDVANAEAVRAMPGVLGVHKLPGAVAVTADRWWRARKAVEALEVAWLETPDAVPDGFTSAARLDQLREASRAEGAPAEQEGDVASALAGAARVVEAEYDAPFLAHAQIEPPSALARFAADGGLEIWLPNQAPEIYAQVAAGVAGIEPARVTVHSPMLGGFFGRHFVYQGSMPLPQAVLLAKETGRPVKVIWSREEEFARDAYRPLAFARFRAGLDVQGNLVALDIRTAGEGPMGRNFGATGPVDPSVVEGLAEKPYRVANKRVGMTAAPLPRAVGIGFWRSVGHSMNDAFYESFLDEVAQQAGTDPFTFRRSLLAHSPRHLALLDALRRSVDGPWRMGAFTLPDGARRARGVAMASPFGSETATLAEVSLRDGEAVVHDLWIAIDPGRVVNPGLVRSQVESAAAIGLSSALGEEVAFEGGAPVPRNFDAYTVLRRDAMPRVHVTIVESGAPMGGVGEPGTPGVPPAVLNAVAALTGRRVRSLPLAKTRLSAA